MPDILLGIPDLPVAGEVLPSGHVRMVPGLEIHCGGKIYRVCECGRLFRPSGVWAACGACRGRDGNN